MKKIDKLRTIYTILAVFILITSIAFGYTMNLWCIIPLIILFIAKHIVELEIKKTR